MDRHLIAQIEQAKAYRDEQGWETNMAALATWFMWAQHPLGCVLEYRDYSKRDAFGEYPAVVPHEQEYWFQPVPIFAEGSYEDPSMWISPRGFSWSVGYGHHCMWMTLAGLSYDLAQKLGWVHVSGGRADPYFPMTALQLRALRAADVNVRNRSGMWIKDEYIGKYTRHDLRGQALADRYRGLDALPRRKQRDWRELVAMSRPSEYAEDNIAF